MDFHGKISQKKKKNIEKPMEKSMVSSEDVAQDTNQN